MSSINLGKITLAYPFIEYGVQVIHHTERKSTVMEWVLLEIACIAEEHTEYKEIPLADILDKIFSIVDGNLLLRQVLIDLIDMNALERISGFGDHSDWGSLRCGDLVLSDKGRQLQKEGRLPAKEQKNQLEIIFDVVGGTVNQANREIKTLSNKPATIRARDISLENLPGFPDILIRQLIRKLQATGENTLPWLQPDSHIDRIFPEQNRVQIKWKCIGLDAAINDEGMFTLREESDESIVERVLQQMDFGSAESVDASIISSDELSKMKSPYPYKNIKQKIHTYASNADIFLLAPQFEDMLTTLSKKTCMLFGQPDFSDTKDANSNSIIKLAQKLEKGICYQDRNHTIYVAFINTYAGKTTRKIPFAYESESHLDDRILNIVKKYYRDKPIVLQLLKFMYKPPYRLIYTKEYMMSILNSRISMEEFTPVDKYLMRLKEINNKILGDLPQLAVPDRNRTFHRTLLQIRKEKGKIFLKDMRELLNQWDEALVNIQNKTDIDLRAIDWQDSEFGCTMNRMKELSGAINFFFKDSDSRYKRIYVMDTSAIMHFPKVLDDFASNKALVVIPKSVLSELKELDYEDKNKEARLAINKIEKYSKEKWMSLKEDSYEELLPEIHRTNKKNAELILSVALKYEVNSSVVVITDDNNMKDFAHLEGLEVMTVKELHNKLNVSVLTRKN